MEIGEKCFRQFIFIFTKLTTLQYRIVAPPPFVIFDKKVPPKDVYYQPPPAPLR